MLLRQFARILIRAVLSILLPGCFLLAQDQWNWPEKPANLQVLPKDWPGSRLSPVMRGFTGALGVRCSHCHVGEEGKPLTSYDFASDENPNKNRAREMLRMLGSINDHLKNVKPSGDKRVNMWCHTCHAGRAKPMTLEEELGEQYRKRGIDAALKHYEDLKSRFYGRGSYDFSERSLNSFAYAILQNDASSAVRVFTLNAEMFRDSPNVWDSLGEGYLKSGDSKRAIECYERVLSMDPNNANARKMLEEIRRDANK